MDRQVKGILGAKLGMTQVWDNNKVVPVTVVQAGPCVVTQVRTADTDGYSAVQLAFGAIDPRKANKPRQVTSPRRRRSAPSHRRAADLRRGRVLARSGSHRGLVPGGLSGRRDRPDQGQGFAGVMKRHGFHGLRASHGVERKHRSPGSIGACATPGRVFKGVRMAGRMGSARYTVQNLTVQAVDVENNLLLVRGAIPGPKGALILVRSAAKAPVKKGAVK